MFFDLPYWHQLDVRHSIALMHVEKNGEPDSQSTHKKSKHVTRLRELTLNRSREQRIPIQFDLSIGNPLGEKKKQFKSYAALLGCGKPSILKNDWDDAEIQVYKRIWDSIKVFPSNPTSFTIIVVNNFIVYI
ncbi:hypothetical protein L6164_001255 [Bauhinia variegata]|uniref:Uncharacterized protein n=1 Tax=Bauhinia variegata TaxID=167791 RepID=A0ACB9Q8W1_BAUVA|nr:hypothetical protein L6164_001255 [Bauhinia variegata]